MKLLKNITRSNRKFLYGLFGTIIGFWIWFPKKVNQGCVQRIPPLFIAELSALIESKVCWNNYNLNQPNESYDQSY